MRAWMKEVAVEGEAKPCHTLVFEPGSRSEFDKLCRAITQEPWEDDESWEAARMEFWQSPDKVIRALVDEAASMIPHPHFLQRFSEDAEDASLSAIRLRGVEPGRIQVVKIMPSAYSRDTFVERMLDRSKFPA